MWNQYQRMFKIHQGCITTQLDTFGTPKFVWSTNFVIVENGFITFLRIPFSHWKYEMNSQKQAIFSLMKKKMIKMKSDFELPRDNWLIFHDFYDFFLFCSYVILFHFSTQNISFKITTMFKTILIDLFNLMDEWF